MNIKIFLKIIGLGITFLGGMTMGEGVRKGSYKMIVISIILTAVGFSNYWSN